MLTHALEGVGAGTGLVGAASEHGGAGVLHATGDADEVLALHRAGSGDDLEVAAAEQHAVPAVHHGVGGMEFAVRLLEGLGDALHALHDVHGLEQERVDLGGVSHEADDGLVLAVAHVGL